MRSVLRGFRAMIGITWANRKLVIEAIAHLAFARLILLVFPFHRVARRLGEANAPDATRSHAMPAATAQESMIAQNVGWAVRRAATVVPFKAACLQQGVAAQGMLRRRSIGSVLHFGVTRCGGTISAHAWLDAVGTEVTGYPVGREFSELVCFRSGAQ